MDGVLLNLSDEYCRGIFPSYVCDIINKSETLIFGIEESDQIRAIIVFSILSNNMDSINFEYVYVPIKYRHQGYADNVFDYAFQELRYAGYKTVYFKFCKHNEYVYRMLRSEGFMPITFNGKLVEFNMHDLLHNRVFNKLLQCKRPYIMPVTSTTRSEVNRFMKYLNKVTDIYNGNLAYEYCRFYMEEGAITACILWEKIDKNILFMSDVYIDNKCSKKDIFAYLMIESMIAVRDFMDADTIIKMQLYTDSQYNFIKKLNIKDIREYQIKELVKIL